MSQRRRTRAALAVIVGAGAGVFGAAASPTPAGAVVPRPDVPTIAVSHWNGFIVDHTGRLRGTGWTGYEAIGEAGEGPERTLRALPRLPGGVTPVMLDSTGSRVVIVGSDGGVYGSGANFAGHLGTDTPGTVTPFLELPGLPDDSPAVDLATSQHCTIVLTDGGRIFRTGGNPHSQCPIAPATNPHTFSEMPGVPPGRSVVDVSLSSANEEFLLVLLDDGTLLGSGNNDDGQLPGIVGDAAALTPLTVPVEPREVVAAQDKSLFIGADGQAYGAGQNVAHELTGPPADVTAFTALAGLPGGVTVEEIAWGHLTTTVLGSDGGLYAAGNIGTFLPQDTTDPTNVDALTPLPLPAQLGQIAEIEGASDSWLVRGHHGLVWASGGNGNGQLARPDLTVHGWQLLAGQPPVSLSRPRATGTARVRQRLTATRGSWTPAPDDYAYQWRRGAKPIPGGTKRRYRLTRKDLGRQVSVRVTATTDGVPARATSRARTVRRAR